MIDLTGIVLVRNPDPANPGTWLMGVVGRRGNEKEKPPLPGQSIIIDKGQLDLLGSNLSRLSLVIRSVVGGTRQSNGTLSWTCVVHGGEVGAGNGRTICSYTNESGTIVPGPNWSIDQCPIVQITAMG